jgi:hypothetical protein
MDLIRLRSRRTVAGGAGGFRLQNDEMVRPVQPGEWVMSYLCSSLHVE